MNDDTDQAVAAPRGLRARLVAVTKVVVSLGLIVALAYWTDWSSVTHAVAKANVAGLLMGLAFIAPTVALAAWRWSWCARASSIDLPLSFYVRATYSALFVGQFLPAAVGVDAARLAFFVQRKARLAHAVQSLALDRVIGVVSVICVLAIGLPVIWDRLPGPLKLFGLGLVAATVVGLLAILLLDRIPWLISFAGTGKRRKLIDLVLGVRRSIISGASLRAFIASGAIYCLMILGVYCIARAIGVVVSYPSLLAIVAIAMFVSLLPVSVNGWGVREGAMVTGLSALAVAREHALAISLLFGVANAFVTVPGAFVWYLRRKQTAVAVIDQHSGANE